MPFTTADLQALAAAAHLLTTKGRTPASDEGHALGLLLKNYVARTHAPQGGTATTSFGSSPQSDSGAEKHWTAVELAEIRPFMPFLPKVYVTKFDRKKKFHLPSCFWARYGDSWPLEHALEQGYKPCDLCGGVRSALDNLELAYQIEEILHHLEDLSGFAVGDYSGLLHIYDAAKITGIDLDELEKEVVIEAKKQLAGVKEDRYFQIRKYINVLRYKDSPKGHHYSFKFLRQDCIRYSREWGPLAIYGHPPRTHTY